MHLIIFSIFFAWICMWLIDGLLNSLECFFGIEDHVALDRKPGPAYNTLFLRLISGNLLSSCPMHNQFHTLPGLLDSRAVLSNSNPYASVPSMEAVCTIFMMVFGVWPGREANPQPNTQKTNTLTTKPSQRSGFFLKIRRQTGVVHGDWVLDIKDSSLSKRFEYAYMMIMYFLAHNYNNTISWCPIHISHSKINYQQRDKVILLWKTTNKFH